MKQRVTKMGKRLNAWILTLVMIIGLVTVPAGKVKAESVTGKDAKDSSKPVYVVFSGEKSDWGYTQYDVCLYNNSGSAICDWTITIKFSQDPGFKEGWNGVSYSASNQTITIQTYGEASWDNATIQTGDQVKSAGFQLYNSETLNNANVTITYSIGESTSGPATGSGSGSGSSGGGQGNTTTDKNLDIEYNFAKLLQYSLYFYDANMCGELKGKCAVDWRGNCHTTDKRVTYSGTGQTVDVSGGFHDAGDHDKFGLPQAYSASILGIGYYEYKEAYEKTGQVAHFKKILDYFCDYFVRCTVTDSSGKAIAFCYQVGDGSDHTSWLSAEKETNNRPAYFADSSNPATDQVSEAAAALAIHYMNFKNEHYLDYAKRLFAMAERNNKVTKDSDTATGEVFYKSTSWADDYCLAAAWLYKATKDGKYLTEYNKYKGSANLYSWPSWDDVGAYALAYGPDGDYSPLATNAVSNINASKTISNGYTYLAQWGSARYNCNMQLEGLIYDKHSGKNQQYTKWANGQMKFLLGNSDDKRCYVVGYNKNSSKYPHHRTASGYPGMPNTGYQTTTQAHVLTGALVGGIESADGSYHDSSADYTCNEVAIDYNAAFTGAAAALYLLNANDGDQMLDSNYPIDKGATCPANKGGIAKNSSADAGDTKKPGDQSQGGSGNDPAKQPEEGTNPNDKVTKATSLKVTASVKGISNLPIRSTMKLARKKTMTLQVSFLPEGAQKQGLTYTSSNKKVATVDQKGKITAKKAGKTTITVKSVNGLKKSFKVKVMKKAVTKIKLSASKKVLKKGKSVTVKAKFTPSTGISKELTWTSSNPNVATVSSKGKVKAKKKGKVKITAKAKDGSGKKATITIKVK